MKRGEIYYIEIPYSTGKELCKTRPGVVIGVDPAQEDGCVSVIYTSASCHRDSPFHVTLRTTPVVSTAYCEHVYTVDKSRIGTLLGTVTPEELRRIEIAAAAALGLLVERPPAEGEKELADVRRERDLYMFLYNSVVEKLQRTM